MSAIDTLIISFQIDGTTVPRIVGAVLQFLCFRTSDALADGALLATTEYLEGISGIEVNGGRAPYFGLITVSTAKHVERLTEHVHALLVEDDTRASLLNLIAIVGVKDGLTFVLFYLVEDAKLTFAVDCRGIEVDDHVTIYMTAVVAATIDVTAFETAVDVISCTFYAGTFGDGRHLLTRRSTDGVPLQYAVTIGVALISDIAIFVFHDGVVGIPLHFPSHGLHLQTAKVENQFVADGAF